LCIVQSLKKQAFPNIEIVVCRTIREPDGLAMSSRNIRLSPKHRIASAKIYERLLMVKNHSKIKTILELKEWINHEYLRDLYLRLDYFEISNPESLVPSVKWKNSKEHLACVAVYAGEVRLIDNIRIKVN
jgi:pantoate--beta-alanine ligase